MSVAAPSPPLLPLLVFVATYAAVGVGRIPRLALDRTGFAILGAVALLASGSLSLDQAKDAIDAPTLAVLFGMMLLSAQYRLSGLYGAIVRRLSEAVPPRRLLAGTIAVTALLSAVLTNDVVCFALTPLVAEVALRAGLPPLPLLLGIACASNIGSALTPIGNPQNILIAQRLELGFAPFVLACALPVVLSLVAVAGLLGRELRRAAADAPPPAPGAAGGGAPEYDAWQARKAIGLTVAAIALFLSPLPAPLTALAVAGVILTSRKMSTRQMLAHVDWHLLALFMGLFVVVRGLESSGWVALLETRLAGAGMDLARPLVAAPVVVLLGNLVGNVPAVMLLLPFTPRDPVAGWSMALFSTFAGNALLFGSVANIIVAERAREAGIELGFVRHLKTGLPVTLVSLLVALLASVAWPWLARTIG